LFHVNCLKSTAQVHALGQFSCELLVQDIVHREEHDGLAGALEKRPLRAREISLGRDQEDAVGNFLFT